jgi:hypothetical protein
VKVGALVEATYDGADEVGVFPDLLVAHGGLEHVFVFVNPVLKIQRRAVVGDRGDGFGFGHGVTS